MEFGVLVLLAVVGLAIGAFWINGTTSDQLRILHRP